LILTLLAGGAAGAGDVFDPDAFAHTYNAWTVQLKLTPVGGINSKSIEGWIETKEQWKILQKHVDEYYRNQGMKP
jgi:hypothetical protein